MYIKKIVTENIGPIEKIEIFPSFYENKNPKPLLIVGENGTGKSVLLSNIVDSLYELAGGVYSDIRKPNDNGYQYFKAISPIEIKLGQQYMYSYIEFDSAEYVFKSGILSFEDFSLKLGSQIKKELSWGQNPNHKKAIIKKEVAENMFEKNVCCYFGPDRYEKPVWMGEKHYNLEISQHLSLRSSWNGKLGKPIKVSDMTKDTLTWILDLIVDSRCDVKFNGNNGTIINTTINDLQLLSTARSNLEAIISNVLGEPVFFGLNYRNTNNSRFNIRSKANGETIIPTLDSLSTGQSALFNMFATIIRYADLGDINKSISLNEISGIVVIDEIELHLHSNLQHEILPKLIALFPKVQFIITTHSPLFLLGMQSQFGSDGFDILQMPNGVTITSERFSEFEKAYEYFAQTKLHEETLQDEIAKHTGKMLVITEGATDWVHMLAAYEKLKSLDEYNEIFEGLEFEFLKHAPSSSAIESKVVLEMGNTALISLCENTAKLGRPHKTIFIADCDDDNTNRKLSENGKNYKSWGNDVYSFILPIPPHREKTPKICIEHLYSDEVIKTDVMLPDVTEAKRLYMGNEFDERGISLDKTKMCEKKTKCGPSQISVIEGSKGERVTLINDENINLALPKSEFAKMVLNGTSPFDNVDFSAFVDIFRIIKEISSETN